MAMIFVDLNSPPRLFSSVCFDALSFDEFFSHFDTERFWLVFISQIFSVTFDETFDLSFDLRSIHEFSVKNIFRSFEVFSISVQFDESALQLETQ